MEFVSIAQLEKDIVENDIDLVVGVPRSGMLG